MLLFHISTEFLKAKLTIFCLRYAFFIKNNGLTMHIMHALFVTLMLLIKEILFYIMINNNGLLILP